LEDSVSEKKSTGRRNAQFSMRQRPPGLQITPESFFEHYICRVRESGVVSGMLSAFGAQSMGMRSRLGHVSGELQCSTSQPDSGSGRSRHKHSRQA